MAASRSPAQGGPTFGVITALPKEYAAVASMLDSSEEAPTAGRNRKRYLVGEIAARRGGTHRVVVALLPAMGNNSAAARAALLLEHFPTVRHILMVGIAGAAPNVGNPDEHVRLGDIVVSSQQGVVQYDYVAEKEADSTHRHPPRPPGAELTEAVRLLEADELAGQRPWLDPLPRARNLRGAARPPEDADVLWDSAGPPNRLEHPQDPARVPGQPRVFYGTIGSANVLLKNPQKRDRMRALFSIRAFEMEGSGIADAAWDENVGYLVIRGTCDYCDQYKNDRWQVHAAVLAAAYMRALVQSIPAETSTLARLDPTVTATAIVAAGGATTSGSAAAITASLESRVAEIYRLLHFEVETHRVFSGRVLPLFLRGRFGGILLVRAVDCIDGNVDIEHVDSFLARLRLVTREHPSAQGIILSTGSFSSPARAHAAAEGIELTSLNDLGMELLNGGTYAKKLLEDFSADEKYRPALYIEPLASLDTTGAVVAAREMVESWLAEPDWNQLTLLGDVGTGKTFLVRILAYRLAAAYVAAPHSNPLPILIDLRNADRHFSLEGLISTFLYHHGMQRVTFDAFQHALKAGRIVLLLDGFDEMAARVTPQVTTRNFNELARCVSGRAKVLLTCRTHYFRNRRDEEQVVLGAATDAYETETARELYWDLVTRKGFKIAYLRSFTTAQIEAYVARARPDDAGETIRRMRDIYDLMELSKRPMLLDIIVRSIDKLRGRTVNASELYRVFTDVWINRDAWRDVLSPAQKLELLTAIARMFWVTGKSSIHFDELLSFLGDRFSGPRRDPGLAVEIDSEIRTASFLTRNDAGDYAFAHKSYGEFFLARYLSERLQQGDVDSLGQNQPLSTDVIGFLRYLGNQEVIEDRLAIALKAPYKPLVSENALRCIIGLRELRRRDDRASRDVVIRLPDEMQLEGAHLAGASLVRIVAYGVNLAGADLSGSRLSHSVLDGSRLEGADMRGADLRGTSFRGAIARGARLTQANLESAVLDGADFTGARFDDCIFVNVAHAGARFDDTSFAGAEFGDRGRSPIISLTSSDLRHLDGDVPPRTTAFAEAEIGARGRSLTMPDASTSARNLDREAQARTTISRLAAELKSRPLRGATQMDDAVQDTLMALYLLLLEDRIQDVKDLRAYAVTTIRRRYFAELRKQARLVNVDDLPDWALGVGSPSDEPSDADLELLRQLLDQLDDRSRRILGESLAGKSTSEIAQSNGLSLEAVRQIVFRSRKRMAQWAAESGPR